MRSCHLLALSRRLGKRGRHDAALMAGGGRIHPDEVGQVASRGGT
jgi:hypothetical protein